MPQTRIADDVWQLAEEVSDRMGLNSPRLAIEAIVRVCASHYTAGSLHHIPQHPQPVQPRSVKTEPLHSVSTEPDAAAAISDLMQSFT